MSKTLTASDRKSLIRLASSLPAGDEMRRAILSGLTQTAGRTWGGPDAGKDWDWNKPNYAKHENSPDAGENGSEQRKRYNKWYRENVCPTEHGTGCGMD